MNKPPDIPAVFISVDLAREPDFALGPLQVRPSIRRAVRGDREEAVQPRVMQVLVALARANGGVVSREELIASCWDNLIVGDDSITHCIAKVRQLADCNGEQAFEIETIPRVGYRLLARAQPVDPGTVAVPATRTQTTELTASAAHGSLPPKPVHHPRRIALLAALLGAVVVVAAAILFRTAPMGPSENPRALQPPVQTTAAVLPFTPLYSDRNARVYADEISSDVADTLGQTDLNVISPALSFRFRGDGKAGAARALHADILVDGDVRRNGDNFDVAIRVEDVASGLVLLSKNIVAPAAQAPDLPDRIATFVAGALGFDVSIRALNSSKRSNPRVRTGILRALFQCPHRQDPFCSYEIGRKLVSMAPDNAVAQTILAIETTNIWDSLPERERKSAVDRARNAAWSAIRLDPHFGEPYIALSQLTENTAAKESYLRRGLSADPDSFSVAAYLSALLYSTGRSEEGLAVIQRVAARYKFEDSASTNQIWALLGLGRTAEALEIAKRARRLWPDTQLFVLMLFDATAFGRDPAGAEAMLSDPVMGPILHSPGEPPTVLDLVRALRTRAGADIETLSHDCATDPRPWLRTHWCLAGLTMLGRIDDAFRLPSNQDAENVLFWPQTAPMRADPRFAGLAEKLGLIAYWKAAHTRPDFCATEHVPVCRALTAGDG